MAVGAGLVGPRITVLWSDRVQPVISMLAIMLLWSLLMNIYMVAWQLYATELMARMTDH